MIYRIVLTAAAQKMFASITDRRIQELIRDRIDGLSQEPEKKGKPLAGELSGYRSLRAVGQRYRIIYCVIRQKVTVSILAMGIRREGSRADIYELAKRLVQLGLVENN